MTSPRMTLAASLILAALAAPVPAFAKTDAEARAAALTACRAAVAQSLGVDASVLRLSRMETRPRRVEIQLEVRRDGARAGLASCEFNRFDDTATVAVIEPATQTAQAETRTDR